MILLVHDTDGLKYVIGVPFGSLTVKRREGQNCYWVWNCWFQDLNR